MMAILPVFIFIFILELRGTCEHAFSKIEK